MSNFLPEFVESVFLLQSIKIICAVPSPYMMENDNNEFFRPI
jgi:hypothetical protein